MAGEARCQGEGRCKYMLAYGALDGFASGCWTRNGGVTLNAQKLLANGDDPMKSEQRKRTIAPGGELMRRFDAARRPAPIPVSDRVTLQGPI